MALLREWDSTKPTFYLDNSVLCDAFQASTAKTAKRAHPCYAPLFPWIERVAREANLCLSAFHIAELGRWEDTGTAEAMARWYEHLPIVWMKSVVTLDVEEIEHCIKIGLGLDAGPVVPFARSLLASFHQLTADVTPSLLARPHDQVMTLLVDSRKTGQERRVQQMQALPQSVRDDRAWADAQGWSDERKKAETAARTKTELRQWALKADAALRARGDGAYVERAAGADVGQIVIDVYETDSKALPHFRAKQRFIGGLFDFAMRRSGTSKRELEALSGTFHDFVHASVGAAYCDVFTCDGEVEKWLGDLRSQLGFAPQLGPGRHPGGNEGFVQELTALWP